MGTKYDVYTPRAGCSLHGFGMPAFYQFMIKKKICIVQASSGFIAVRTLFIRDVMTIFKAKKTNDFTGGYWQMDGHRRCGRDGVYSRLRSGQRRRRH
jgi:hypothetical protein